MKERSTNDAPVRDDQPRPPRRLAVGVTGTAVAAVCVGYAAWSLFEGRTDETKPAGDGVSLVTPVESMPDLSPTPQEPIPTARLTLDQGEDRSELPVINAHLEVSGTHDEAVSIIEVSPAVRQLSFEAAPPHGRPAGAVGAWLTGTIETLPAGPETASPPPAPYVR